MNDIVLYTVITGGYDTLEDPLEKEDGIDYICLTDDVDNVKSQVWDVRPIPEWSKTVPMNKRQRMLKVLPHILFPQYKMSVYVDGNMHVKRGIYDLVKEHLIDGNRMICIPRHPVRSDIYREAIAILKLNKDTPENVTRQTDRYHAEGFPLGQCGLYETGIVLRRHMEADVIRLMEKWALEIMIGSHRDQLSLTYAMWRTGVDVFALPKALKKSKCFSCDARHISTKKK